MGIDTLAQLLALGAFLLGFAGIAMVVVSASRGEPVNRGISCRSLASLPGSSS